MVTFALELHEQPIDSGFHCVDALAEMRILKVRGIAGLGFEAVPDGL
ncbi:hypothetical protein [Enterovirga rhinocerotis]|nr:hypothetical protein [Enterovirga rhinocerotis]